VVNKEKKWRLDNRTLWIHVHFQGTLQDEVGIEKAFVEFWFFECSKIYRTSPDFKLNAYVEIGVKF
jgi:hypothetical protein